MKKVLSVLIVTLFFNITFSQGVSFEHGTFSEVLEKAKKENKLVFMDCYTTWCGPCKWMTKEIFPQKEVGDFFNKNFVSIKVDMEKGEGVELNTRYGVKAYPTLLFIDANGQIIHQLVGGKPADELIKGAENALNPSMTMSAMTKKYENGERDLDFVLSYIDVLDQAYSKKESQKVSKELMSKLPVKKFANKDMFKVIANSDVDYNSEAYQYVLKNKEMLLSKKIDSTQYFGVISGAIRNYLENKAETVETLDELKAEIEKCKKDYASPYQEVIEQRLTYTYYLAQKDFDTWFNLKLEEANKQKGEQSYVYTVHDIGDEVLRNPKFEGSKASIDRVLKLGHELYELEDNSGIIMGGFLLAKTYLRAKNKEEALKYFNIFFEENKKSGGNNDHPSVSSVLNAIEIL
ncbi:thioredoxin family protein [Algibacter sp. Ld11]|uniref:thioredoxin family protein n=1 Tax=Algibacter sp. Ld11 TaxID=649150 RepID=UPI0038705A29